MKSFLSFCLEEFDADLMESVDNPTKPGSVSNNTRGTLHELLVGKHLNGGNHMKSLRNELGETPAVAHDRLKTQIHPDDYAKIESAAKSAASHIRNHLEKSHPDHIIQSVVHTSKPGDTHKVTGIHATQKQDSSDVYVTTRAPNGAQKHHGVSLKVTGSSNKHVPASNFGVESSGAMAKELHAAHKDSILKSYPVLAGKNKAQRKQIVRADPKMNSDIRSRNTKLLHSVAQAHATELQNHIKSGNHGVVVKHVKELLHAHTTPAQDAGHNFFKHTTYETKNGVQHHVSNPHSDHSHILNDPKGISVEHKGTNVNFYHNGKKFATQHHKFESQSDPLSSLKSSGGSN